MRTNTGRRANALACALLLALGCVAHAGQVQPPPDKPKKPARARETVITASMLERLAGEEPVSVHVVTQEDMVRTGARTVGDALRWVPGVNISGGAPFAAASRTTALIQGLPAQYSLILVNGQRAKSDHIHTGVNLELIPVSQIERIEIIRGPGSVVHGSDALGGVVNIITKPVPDDSTTGIYSLYGSENTWDLNLYHGDRRGKFGYLFSGTHSESDGTGDGDENRYDRDFADLKLLLEPSELFRTSLDLSAYEGDYKESEDSLYTAKLGLEAGDDDDKGRISGTLGFADYNRKLHNGAARADNDMWDATLQYDLQIDRRNYIIVGAEWRREEFERLATPAETDTVKSIYAQYEHQLLKSTTLLLGARYDESRRHDGEVSPRGAVHWAQGPADVRVSLAKGFRLPSLQDLFEFHYDHTTLWRDGNPDLDPETSMHYSVEGEYRLFESQLLFQGLVFRNNIDDMITLRNTGAAGPDGDPVLMRDNIREAYTQGFEVGATALPACIAGLRLDLSYAYLDSEDKETGDYLAYNPKNTVKAGVAYTRGIWSAGAQAQFVADRYYRDKEDAIGTLDDYLLVDVNLGVEICEAGRLGFVVKNILDEEFDTYEEGKALSSYGRFIGVTFRKEWGGKRRRAPIAE
ncbi:TonB-dependent receptor [bacterium]|nr:TonB-dependent receptor [bacterium]